MMNKWIKRKLCIGVAIAMTITSIAGCNSAKSGKNSVDSAAQKTETSSEKSDDSKKAEAPQIDGLTYESAMDLTYAQEFDVFYYKDGYKLIDVHEGRQYLIVPEGKEAPETVILLSSISRFRIFIWLLQQSCHYLMH